MASPINQISAEQWALYGQGKLPEMEAREIDEFLQQNGLPEEFKKLSQPLHQDSLVDEIRLKSNTFNHEIATKIIPGESEVSTLKEMWPDIFPELGNPILSQKQTIGNYRLIENVSVSKMGRVYRGEDLRNGSKVAIKFPPDSLGLQTIERFRREIRVAKRLKHPQIVTVIDELHFRSMPVYVMPWVEGVDLGRLLQIKGVLKIDDVVEIGRQSALILDYLNKHGVVHRDIKPSNLILTHSGEIKMIDLGLAIWQQYEVTDETLTESIQLLGSLDYMAPEQAREPHSTDIRADIYSLGCTLYKLATGKAPFENKKERHVLQKIMAHALDDFQDAHITNASIPVGFSQIINKMCAKKLSDRYSNPRELAILFENLGLQSNLQRLITESTDMQIGCKPDSKFINGQKTISTSRKWIRTKVMHIGVCLLLIILAVASYNPFKSFMTISRNTEAQTQENAQIDFISESDFPIIFSSPISQRISQPKTQILSSEVLSEIIKVDSHKSIQSTDNTNSTQQPIALSEKESLFIADVIDNGIAIRIPGQMGKSFCSGIITPQYVVFDSNGNLFVSSFWTNSIWKIKPDGSLSVFASSGLNGPRGLTFDSSGNLYVANSNGNTISKITPDGKTRDFISTGLAYPYGLACDHSDNLYVANSKTDSILKIGANQKIQTFATLPKDSGPQGLKFDVSGMLYSANHNGTVSQIDRYGVVTLFASGFGNVIDIAFDSNGSIYCSDYDTKSISRINQNGDILILQCGFKQPFGLAIKSSQ